MWPDANDVVNESPPERRLQPEFRAEFRLEVLHINVGQEAGQWRAHCYTIYLLVKGTIKGEHSGFTT